MSVASVTVFGGSGFVGRHVVRELAKAGAAVRVAVRRPDRALFLKPMGDVGQITPVAANIRDDASVAAAVEGSEAVVNLVGILFEAGRRTFDAVHRQGAGRIARAAKAAGAMRLVHVSAIGAHDGAASSYARSKAAGEAAVRAEFPGAAVIRPSIVFGADDNFFNLFAALARLSPVLPLIGGGKTRFSRSLSATSPPRSRRSCRPPRVRPRVRRTVRTGARARPMSSADPKSSPSVS